MNFLKKIGIKLKLIFGFILASAIFIAYLVIKGKINFKNQLEYELSRVKSKIEIANLEEKTNENLEKVENLKNNEKFIRDKIKYLEEKEKRDEEVSLEELDKFFDDRGF